MRWGDYADYHYEPDMDKRDRDFTFDERTSVARMADMDLEGENRFYVAPALDGSWYSWGDWHPSTNHPSMNLFDENSDADVRKVPFSEEAGDACYTFADGGAFFPTRHEAMAAIYRWMERESKLNLQHVRKQTSV